MLDDVEEWETTLSGGEKQRIAWARIFHHRPRFALLDEVSAGVSVEKLDSLFVLAKQMDITLVSISHDLSLEHHHSQVFYRHSLHDLS